MTVTITITITLLFYLKKPFISIKPRAVVSLEDPPAPTPAASSCLRFGEQSFGQLCNLIKPENTGHNNQILSGQKIVCVF